MAVRNPDTNAIAQAWWRRANKHRHAQPSPAQVPISWQPASQRQAQRGPHVHRVRAASPSLPGRYRTRHPDRTLCLKRAHAAYVTVAIPGANADAKAPAKSGKPSTAQLFDDHIVNRVTRLLLWTSVMGRTETLGVLLMASQGVRKIQRHIVTRHTCGNVQSCRCLCLELQGRKAGRYEHAVAASRWPQPACRMNESCRLCPLGRPPRDVRVDLSCLTQNDCVDLRCSGSASIAAPVHTCVLLEPCFPIPASHVLLAHFIIMGYCTAMACPSACCRSWFP